MSPTIVATMQHHAVHDMTQSCQNLAKSEISILDKNQWLLPSFVQMAVKVGGIPIRSLRLQS